MIKFAQYETFFSLYIILIVLVPVCILGFCKIRLRFLNLLCSIGVVLTILGTESIQVFQFVLFMFFETLLVYLILCIRKKNTKEIFYYLTFALSVLPLFTVRIAVHTEIGSIVGFTGISYICFKIWQLIFEIHDGKIKSLNFIDYLSFLIFFPSFSSGPIARYQDFNKYNSEKK